MGVAMRPWLVAMGITVAATAVQAHEFWIEPQSYHLDPGQELIAQIFVGQDFKGREQSYLPRNFQEFTLTDASGQRDVEMALGDRPALRTTLTHEGTGVIGYISNPMRVIYQDVEKFKAFLSEKDFEWALEAHRARGLGTDRIAEAYLRYGKSLVHVGDRAGSDRDLGYEIELIAQTDLPFATGEVEVLLEYQDQPLADTQITLWRKNGAGDVTHALYRTNDVGGVVLPVEAGHSYLVDAVVIRPLEQRSQNDPSWETIWASLTFAVQ